MLMMTDLALGLDSSTSTAGLSTSTIFFPAPFSWAASLSRKSIRNTRCEALASEIAVTCSLAYASNLVLGKVAVSNCVELETFLAIRCGWYVTFPRNLLLCRRKLSLNHALPLPTSPSRRPAGKLHESATACVVALATKMAPGEINFDHKPANRGTFDADQDPAIV